MATRYINKSNIDKDRQNIWLSAKLKKFAYAYDVEQFRWRPHNIPVYDYLMLDAPKINSESKFEKLRDSVNIMLIYLYTALHTIVWILFFGHKKL